PTRPPSRRLCPATSPHHPRAARPPPPPPPPPGPWPTLPCSPSGAAMSVSRRTLLLAGGTAATLLPLGGILPAAQAAPSAAGATPAATPVPDPIPVTGTWTRTSDGGQKATAGRRGPALALSEQQLATNGMYAARVTPQSAASVGALVFRAALDGSAGYAVALDPGRAR